MKTSPSVFSALLPREARRRGDEHELKLEVDAGSPLARAVERIEELAAQESEATHRAIADAFEQLFGLEVSGIKKISRVQHFSVYYDTAELDLCRLDASLRMRRRRSGGYRVNAKSPDVCGDHRGHLVRGEWRYTLAQEVFEFLERMRFLPLVEHHYAEVFEGPIDARRALAPVVQIHKRSARIQLLQAGGQSLLLSLDRFTGFGCRDGEVARSTRELREVEIEALNDKAARGLGAVCDRLASLRGVTLCRPKYQTVVRELALDPIGSDARSLH